MSAGDAIYMVAQRKLTDAEKQQLLKHAEMHKAILVEHDPFTDCVVCLLYIREGKNTVYQWREHIFCYPGVDCFAGTHSMPNTLCPEHARELHLIW